MPIRIQRCRVRLSHLEVPTGGDRPIHLPWAEVLIRPDHLEPSVYARHRWSEMPTRLRTSPAVGTRLLHRLRRRALERQIADGSYRAFFSFPEQWHPLRVALGSAVSTLLVTAGAYIWWTQIAMAGFGGHPDEAARLSRRWYEILTWGMLAGCVGVPLVLAILHWLTRSGPRVRGMWARAGGAELFYDDGRVVTQSWDQLLRRRTWNVVDLAGVPARSSEPSGERGLLMDALARRKLPTRRRWSIRKQVWLGFFGALAFLAVTDLLFVILRLNPPPGRPTPEPLLEFSLLVLAFNVLMSAMFTAATLRHFGLHRLRQRLRQALGLAR